MLIESTNLPQPFPKYRSDGLRSRQQIRSFLQFVNQGKNKQIGKCGPISSEAVVERGDILGNFSFNAIAPVIQIPLEQPSSTTPTLLMGKLTFGDDDTFGSNIERIFNATNGPEEGGCNNPLRQRLSADLAESFRPNNVVGRIPTLALDYSPSWDVQLFTWTEDAMARGFRGQVRAEFQILTFAQDGLITGFPAGTRFGTSNFAINCPIVLRLD